MVHPIAHYRYKQTLQIRGDFKGNPYKDYKGCYDLQFHRGESITTLNDKQEEINLLFHGKNKRISVGINKKKGEELNLNCQAMKQLPPYKTYISALRGTDISNPYIQIYHGDINSVYKPIIIILEYNPETIERFLTILVFNGDKSRQTELYDCYRQGLIDDTVKEDNVPLELNGEIISSSITHIET